MTTRTTTQNRISSGLDRIRQDRRFASLHPDGPTAKCSLCIWILELETDGRSDGRLLYGWIIRSPFPAERSWSEAKGDKWKPDDKDYTYRLRRLVLNDSSEVISSCIRALCDGQSLGEACTASGAPTPPERDALFRLGLDAAEIERAFVVGPVRFLEPPKVNHGILESMRPLNSPSHTQAVFSVALVRLNKSDLWTTEAKQPLPGADQMAEKCLEYLRRETHLDFVGPDSKRLGNIEWIALAAADERENGYVDIDFVRTTDIGEPKWSQVQIGIRSDAPLLRPNCLVRCRFYVGDEIAGDECRTTMVGAAAIVFLAPDDASRVLVTVWSSTEDEQAWSVWYETVVPVIKTISIQTGIAGLQGRVESDWTRTLKTAREDIAKRTDKVRSLSQIFYQTSQIEKRSAWEAAERQVRDFAHRLFPASSGAKFFPRGWAAGEPGVLGFVEWFQELTDDPSVTALLLVDPYFAAAGVTEILARSRATQIEYVVLTTCRLPSNDDEEAQDVQSFCAGDTADVRRQAAIPGSASSSRALQIERACILSSAVLYPLKFTILDLGGAQVHDRYILTFSGNQVRTGYHLSNSIQNATKNYPLLVTPIPSDVIESIASYTSDLIEPQKDGQSEVREVCSSSILRSRVANVGLTPNQWVPYAAEFFSVLLGDPNLAEFQEGALKDYLRRLRMLEGDDRFMLAEASSEPTGLARVLAESDQATFVRLWSAAGWWLAHLPGADDLLEQLASSDVPAFSGNLKRYLGEAPNLDPPQGVRGLMLSQELSGRVDLLFRRPFGEVLYEAFYLVRDGLYCPGQCWGLHYAAALLTRVSPSSLVSACDGIHGKYPRWRDGDDNDPVMWAAANVLATIVSVLLDRIESPDVISALLRARVPLFRAIGVQQLIGGSADAETVLGSLRILYPEECLLAACEWVWHLRIAANRNAGVEDERAQEVCRQVFAGIAKAWPPTIDKHGLRELARRLSGPIEGSWAASITSDLFAELVRIGRLSWEEVAALWFSILKGRIDTMLSVNPMSSEHFYAPTDEQLTCVFAWTLVRCSQKACSGILREVSALRKSGARQLTKPFSGFRDTKWYEVRDALRWLRAIAGEVAVQGSQSLPPAERAKWLGEYNELKRLLGGFRTIEASPLDDLLECVDRRIPVAGT